MPYTSWLEGDQKTPPLCLSRLINMAAAKGAAELYKKLQELIQDINDSEEIELTLPLFKIAFKTSNRG